MKPKRLGVQHQARMGAGGSGGIDLIAKDRVAEGKHMDAKLVAATGAGGQAHAGFGCAAGDDLPVGLGGAAVGRNLLARAIFPIAADGQVNMTLILRDLAMHAGDIGLLRAAVFEFLAKRPLRLSGAGKDDDPAGVAIQPMHQKRVPARGLQPGQQTILPTRQLARDRKQTGGFVEDEDLRILVQDAQR